MEPFLYEPLDQSSDKNGTPSKLPEATNGDHKATSKVDLNGYLDDLAASLATANKRR